MKISSLCKLIAEHGLEVIVKREVLLRVTKDRKLWRVMIVHVFHVHGTWKKKNTTDVEKYGTHIDDFSSL